MRLKKTKGKQKINIKKIERDEDRLVTFSKRRNGIYTKISELSILCGVEVGFLVYSGTGKPYTFGNPSIETVAERFFNCEGSSSSSSSSIMDAQRKVKLEELCKEYNSVVEKSAEAEAIGVAIEAAGQTDLSVKKDAWWKVDDLEMVKEDEDAMQLLKKYEEFYKKLYEVAERKKNEEGDVASSSNRNG